MSLFQLHRLGQIMEAQPGNPQEVEGVTNPAAVRGPDGQLYLFPRLVAKGNYSRIGIARVRFDGDGNPSGVERLGPKRSTNGSPAEAAAAKTRASPMSNPSNTM